MDKWDKYDQERNDLIEELLLLGAVPSMRQLFEQILKEILFLLSDMFMRLEKDGKVSYEDAKRFRDINKVQRRVVTHTRELSKKNRKTIEKLLEESYTVSYSYVSYSIERETKTTILNATPRKLPEIIQSIETTNKKGKVLDAAKDKDREIIVDKINSGIKRGRDKGQIYVGIGKEIEKEFNGTVLKNTTPHLPEILAKVNENPIKGLRLDEAQERDRHIITKNINKAIERGLIAGETYGGIAKEIQKEFDSSYQRAVTIARTETHRVKEQAAWEAAMNSHNQGVIMEKTWRNMKDQRVRPGRGIGKKPASGNKVADHVKMEGQLRLAPNLFNLFPYGTAQAPGLSGIGNQDINCRCYASYRVARIEKPSDEKIIATAYSQWKRTKDRSS